MNEYFKQKIEKFIENQNDVLIDSGPIEGGFGVVYLGVRQTLNDRVALKFYDISNDGIGHEEARLITSLDHSSIIKVFDAKIICEGIAYYLMPEIKDGNLQETIESKKMTTDDAVQVIVGILSGLSELHKPENNLVHRDIKTHNVLIKLDNDKLLALLADFGSVKKIPDGTDSVGHSIWTLLYRPPESIQNNVYTKQSDIYQVGVILYQCLGGEFPIYNIDDFISKRQMKKIALLNETDQEEAKEVCIKKDILSGRLLKIKEMPAHVNNTLIKILRKATNIEVEKRYRDIAEFKLDLFRYMQNCKNWWTENGVVRAYDKRKKIDFFIEKDSNGTYKVSKQINNRKKRKVKSCSIVQDCIKYVEEL